MPEINGASLPIIGSKGESAPAATNGSVSMSTLPQEGHNWQISLKDKVIASMNAQPLPTKFF